MLDWVASFILAFWVFYGDGAMALGLMEMDCEIESVSDQSWIVCPDQVLIMNLFSVKNFYRHRG